MPDKIQRIPGGLLDQLGIRGTGRNPEAVLEELRTVIDLTDYYSVGLIESVSETEVGIQPNAGSVRSTIDVPAGEAWRVLSIGYRVENAASDTAWDGAPFIRPGGVGVALRFGEMNAGKTVNPGIQASAGITMDFIIPPGSQLGTVVQRSAGDTYDLTTIAIINRLRV